MDPSIKPKLVEVGFTLGAQRYVGQHPTDAAHEFANAIFPVLQHLEDQIVKRLREE